MITMKRTLVACAVVVLGLGLFSCTLEPTAESPNGKTVSPLKGVPNSLRVSAEPSVTFDGATTVFTYTVTADFSKWPLVYTTEEAIVASPTPSYKAQSIEALIHYYATTPKGFFVVPSPPPSPGTPPPPPPYSYPLQTSIGTPGRTLPNYVIIPLDTLLIREHLKEKVSVLVEAMKDKDIAADANDIQLVWIEENPAIGEVEALSSGTPPGTWTAGVYEADGIRIGGIHGDAPTPTSYIASTIGNFADGKDGRILSIATVLADEEDQDGKRYTSTISFYISTEARDIAIGLNAPSASPSPESLENADDLKDWMKKDNKPALRVVYEWAD